MPRPFPMRILVFAVFGAAALGGIIALLVLETRQMRVPVPSPGASSTVLAPPHVVGDEHITLSHVELSMVYFVPRDRQELIRKDWADITQKPLEEMRAFHRLQFHGRSDMTYTITPEPIIGEKDGAWYDGTDTNRGNPHAWEQVREELDRRLGGIKNAGEGPFRVRMALYEGVGGLGGEDQTLVSSGYLNTTYASSVFYHELGHTFGLEDAYDYTSGQAESEDVMGLGRQKPIGEIYLSDKAKRLLGI